MSHEPLLGVEASKTRMLAKLCPWRSTAASQLQSPPQARAMSRNASGLVCRLQTCQSVLMHHIGLFLKRVSEARTNSIAGLPSEGGSATVVVMAAEKKSVHGTFDSSSDGDKENQISPRTVLGHANKDASAHSLSGSPTKTNTKADALMPLLPGLSTHPFRLFALWSQAECVSATWARTLH